MCFILSKSYASGLRPLPARATSVWSKRGHVLFRRGKGADELNLSSSFPKTRTRSTRESGAWKHSLLVAGASKCHVVLCCGGIDVGKVLINEQIRYATRLRVRTDTAV